MRIKILFWNYNVEKGALFLNEPDRADPLARLVRSQGIDLVILAECCLANKQILDAFLRKGLDFTDLVVPHPKLKIFRSLYSPGLTPIAADDRIQFVRLTEAGFEDLLIGATHLYDRRSFPSPTERHLKVAQHIDTLFAAESRFLHNRTLIVGDFNMTPEEIGMVDPQISFGAMMSWDLAVAHTSSELNQAPRFFNPMWSLIGRPEAPGTYYWNSNTNHNTFWLCLDGVIVRHSLKGVFLDETLKILTTIPDLENREVPLFQLATKHYNINISDHLPICFELRLKPMDKGGMR